MATLYVRQDGADFYVYSDPEGEQLVKERCCTAPFRVGDYDMEAARRARAWYEEWGYFKGADVVRWLGP